MIGGGGGAPGVKSRRRWRTIFAGNGAARPAWTSGLA